MVEHPGAWPEHDAGEHRSAERPSVSLALPTRHRWSSISERYAATIAELDAVGGELVIAGLGGEDVPAPPRAVRIVSDPERDLMLLRVRAVQACRGSVVAVGEDHAVPAPGWARAVVRAHHEHPAAPAVVGALLNVADGSAAARANFLACGGLYAPPMPEVPEWRPPPFSTISLKRAALRELDVTAPGSLDAIVNRLYEEHALVADDRVLFEHEQDLGIVGTIRQAYNVTRSGYGYAIDRTEPGRRWEASRWAARHLAPSVWKAARRAQSPTDSNWVEWAVVAAMSVANAAGAVVGSMAGSGKAPRRYD
jgi:hypothetical protein